MTKLPFYIPDYEVNLRLGKILLLLHIIKEQKKDKFVLSLEKIAILEFLTKHPILLNKLLSDKKLKIINLQHSEKWSIEAMYPNRGQLFDFKKIKALLNLLITYGLVEIKLKNNYEVYYAINDEGDACASQFESTYFQRLKHILIEMKPLIKVSYSKISSEIEPYL